DEWREGSWIAVRRLRIYSVSPPLCPSTPLSLRPGNGKHRERQILQRSVSDYDQTFIAELGGGGREQRPAQSHRGRVQLRFGPGDSGARARPGFAFERASARRQQIVDSPRLILDLFPFGKFVTGERVPSDGPEVAAFGAERVLQEQRSFAQLLLDLGQSERLRLRKRGVTRAGAADRGLRLLVLVLQPAGFPIQRPRLLRHQALSELLRLGVYLPGQSALAFE